MNDVLEVTASLFECFVVVRFCNGFLGFRNTRLKWLKSAVLFILLAVDNIMFGQLEGFEGVSVCILFLLILGYSLIFLGQVMYEKILVSFIPVLVLPLINPIIIIFFGILSGLPVKEFTQVGGGLRVPVLFFSKLAFFLVCELIVRLKRRGWHSLNAIQWIIQLSCFLLTSVISYLVWNISRDSGYISMSCLLVYIMLAVLNIMLYLLLNKMQYDSAIKEECIISQITIASQEQFVEEARKRYTEMRTFRHDMRHYLTVAAGLISDGRTKEAEEYIEKLLGEKILTAAAGVDTGSAVIDAVINNKIAACAKNNIEIKCMIDLNFGGIGDTDISILLSNALDNAIRGCTGADSPKIELTMGGRKSCAYIIVKNSIAHSVLSGNPKLVTDRKDKSVHGLGIRSMNRIAEKYKGGVEFREGNDMFIVKIWFEKTE